MQELEELEQSFFPREEFQGFGGGGGGGLLLFLVFYLQNLEPIMSVKRNLSKNNT